MIRFSNCASSWRHHVATSAVLIAGLAIVSAASAADLNFAVSSGNFTTAGNWVDATTFLPTGAAPTSADNAFIRNGGTVTIDSDVIATEIRVGARQSITPPDYDSSGNIDAGD